MDPAGFVRLYQAATRGDQQAAEREQARIAELAALEGAAEQPSSQAAIAAFKAALVLLGVIDSATMTPPTAALAGAEIATVHARLTDAGLL